MNTIIENLNWRYATKKFDPNKKISAEDLQTLLEVLRLSPSSYGLQPYKILVVNDPDTREKLQEKSWNQTQITDASHLLVLCSYIDINESHVDLHIDNTAKTREVDLSLLLGYSDFMKANIQNLALEDKSTWNMKQVYLALGFLLQACAQLKIDATPMEGFESVEYDKILGLKDQNLHATVVVPIGYRADDDNYQFNKKVRKSNEELITFI